MLMLRSVIFRDSPRGSPLSETVLMVLKLGLLLNQNWAHNLFQKRTLRDETSFMPVQIVAVRDRKKKNPP